MRSLALLLAALAVVGCFRPDPPAGGTTTTTVAATTPDGWAPSFDGQRALEHVAWQVTTANDSPRYRVPGTPGNGEVASYVADTMEGLGYDVSWHHFNATYGCVETPMHNVVASRPGTSGKTVMFGAHYDSRPIADKDPDPARRDEPVLGANDGGSGVGVLLELARVLPPTRDRVVFLFFDGEDGGGYKGNACTDWILGSRAYAETLTPRETLDARAFVLVDMVGDPELRIPWEMTSRQSSEALQDAVYAAGKRLGYGDVFVEQEGYSIEDDHVPFAQKGIPSLDLIHLLPHPRVFPAWHHTTADDLSTVSAESLAAVGRTLEVWVRETG